MALEDLEPSLSCIEFNPVVFRMEAQRDAALDFEFQTAMRVATEQGWLSSADRTILEESRHGKR